MMDPTFEKTAIQYPCVPAKETISLGVLASVPAYFELTKPRITCLVVLTAVAAFCVASKGTINYAGLLNLSIGIALLSAGINTLNQYLERDADALMRRTQSRPLPTGRLPASRACIFGIVLSVIAIVQLAVSFRPLAALLGIFTFVTYLFLYTPLKTVSPISTTIGAFPGAMPPVFGWLAARGELSVEAWVLFAILFLWQFPHFLAIASLYREDYARAGIKMLPVVQPNGHAMSRQIIGATALLVPVSVLPTVAGLTGWAYVAGALLLGLAFLYFSVRLAIFKSSREARRLLLASVLYLPALLFLMVVGH
jgi:protoheme IX farnesyltransferase